ncbi:uncharacterized protein LOC108103435 [Drosophila eugracilis]|uniref:uncharacterized protein LOC108103435 n=1 Tax=Drosophila eugracilis TaxID=29029 RepID=UPI0007E803F2|nr:uncharacterized protein LOC108103435 [Drosophila eugracilis]
MRPIYTVFLGFSVLFLLPHDVVGNCKLETVPNAPVVVTRFGSKQLLSDSPGIYELETGQTIDLYSASGFFIHRDYRNTYLIVRPNVTMRCNEYGAFQNSINNNEAQKVQCLNGVSQLFESKNSLQNCLDDMTLILANNINENNSRKNLAICYDIDSSRVKYIGYTTFPEKNQVLTMTQLGQLNDIGLDIDVKYYKNLIKTISQKDIDDYMAKEKTLFVPNTFKSDNLVQDESVVRQLTGFEDLTTTIWLRVLSLGNWKNWITAMRDASGVDNHFDIRLGVSGVIEIPTGFDGSCNASRSLKIKVANGGSFPIPAHIWAHIHALEKTGSVQDEFVIIGHNSPFTTYDNSSDLCLSMCDQISWLRNTLFARLHRHPNFGLVYCCRVEDVANKLDNFPGPFAKANVESHHTDKFTTTTISPNVLEFLGSNEQSYDY